MRKEILCVLIFVVFICHVVCAANLFYNGSIVIDSITTDVDIQNTLSVTITYILANNGAVPQTVNVEYSQPATRIYSGSTLVKNPLEIGAGEKKTLTITYPVDVNATEPRSVTLDPTLLFDKKYYPNVVRELVTTIKLPAGVSHILWADKKYSSESHSTGGRVWYQWKSQNDYPTMLTVRWSSLGIDLDAAKSVSSPTITDQYRNVTLDIVFQNKGKAKVNNIILTDNFVPSDFEAVEPLDAFIMQKSNTSDPRLIWREEFGSIMPGEIKRVSYTVRYIGDLSQTVTIPLSPTVLFQADTVVGMSNPVEVSLIEQVVSRPTPLPTTPLNGGVILCALVIMALFYPRIRKRERL